MPARPIIFTLLTDPKTEAVDAIRVWRAAFQIFCLSLTTLDARVLIAAHTKIIVREWVLRVMNWTELTNYDDDRNHRDGTKLY